MHLLRVPSRIVAIGDLHGDLELAQRALRLAGAIDGNDRWIGKNLVVVQTGDQIDRWDQDREILDLFDRLAPEALRNGSHLISLIGNHEALNVRLSMTYVTPEGFESFSDIDVSYELSFKGLKLPVGLTRVEAGVLNRAAAFIPGGPYARLLAKRSFYAIVNDTVFVHGGITISDVKYGLERLNEEMHNWFRGESSQEPLLLRDPGPLWTREYSREDVTPKECKALKKTLNRLHAKRMVVGHTIQKSGINSACDSQVWRIDVGMSQGFSTPGKLQVLEIDEEQIKVLEEPFS